jgi:4-hydroxy 2-oxovalerate aldolase
MSIKLVDCTLRDGGYYNNWDFSRELINEYLLAMDGIAVDYVELGFRSFSRSGFKGACAYTTDLFIRTLACPSRLKLGVMVNASELVTHADGAVEAARRLFSPAAESPVTLVRFACHLHEFAETLPACAWLKESGYEVGINLMQVADRSDEEIEGIARMASACPLDALYFADSLGSMSPEQAERIVSLLRKHWSGSLGIHTHDSMGRALANTVRAVAAGVTWVDSTVTGMGRGPGNVQTEYVVIEFEKLRNREINMAPLLALIRRHFAPLKARYGWGSNPYYYLAGKHGIHPTYISQMLADPRYGESEILSVIEHLRTVGGKKFSIGVMEAGRQMYGGEASGSWQPATVIAGREVLILGAGPGVVTHREAVEHFIRKRKPFVIALNTQSAVTAGLIDVRVASHPFRLLADCETYRTLQQPLVVSMSRIPGVVRESLQAVPVLDFGLTVQPGVYEFRETSAIAPTSLAVAYALAVATSGQATHILLAGFDGYPADDSRAAEMMDLLSVYCAHPQAVSMEAITPSRYDIPATSVYAF